jgi:hypothetical protein
MSKITVFDRFKALNLETNKQDMTEVGMIVSRLYQQIFGEKAEKEERPILTITDVFNVYPPDFSVIIDNCITDWLKSDRRKFLFGRPERIKQIIKNHEEKEKRRQQAKAFKERKKRKRIAAPGYVKVTSVKTAGVNTMSVRNTDSKITSSRVANRNK